MVISVSLKEVQRYAVQSSENLDVTYGNVFKAWRVPACFNRLHYINYPQYLEGVSRTKMVRQCETQSYYTYKLLFWRDCKS